MMSNLHPGHVVLRQNCWPSSRNSFGKEKLQGFPLHFLTFSSPLVVRKSSQGEKKFVCQDIVLTCCIVISLTFLPLEKICYWLSILADVLLRTVIKKSEFGISKSFLKRKKIKILSVLFVLLHTLVQFVCGMYFLLQFLPAFWGNERGCFLFNNFPSDLNLK